MSAPTSAVKRKYNNKAYDRVTVFLKNGQKEQLKNIAEQNGMSLNALTSSAIYEYVEKHFSISLTEEHN